MPIFKKTDSMSLSIIFSRHLLVGLVLAFVIISFFWIQSQLSAFHRDSENLRRTLLKTHKSILRNQVNNALEILSFHHSHIKKSLRRELKSRVREAHTIATNLYENNKDRFTADEIKTMITEALRDIRFNDGRGYYFIVNLEGTEILYPVNPELEGRNLLDLQDDRGKYVIRNEIKMVKQHGEGFVRGHWHKPGRSSDMIYSKISFIREFRPFGWYIGTGEYLDDVRREIQKEVLSTLEEMRYGIRGYIFVKDMDGSSLLREGQVVHSSSGSRHYPQTTSPDREVFRKEKLAAQKATGDFVSYSAKAQQNGETIPHMAFVKAFQPWQWIIGARLSLAQIEAEIDRKRQLLKDRIHSDIQRIVLLMAFLGLGLFLLILYMHKKMRKNIGQLCESFKQAASNDIVTINVPAFDFSEFRSLAESANSMIQERRKVESALNLEKVYFEELFQNAPESIVITDSQSTVLRVNKAFCRLFGYQEDEAIGSNLDELIAPEEKVSEAKQITQRVHDGERLHIETVRRHKDGRRIPVSIFGVPFEVNNRAFVYGIYRDITEKKKAEEDLIRLSETDSLTKLYNRMKFNSFLQDEIRQHKRYQRDFCLAMFDIDRFKAINDSFGHHVGDRVLIGLSSLVVKNIRETDIAARWGGEEFILLLRGADLKAARETAERLRKRIEQGTFGPAGRVTCSFGVVQFLEEDSFESVTNRVDQQLYRAKQAGRNRVVG